MLKSDNVADRFTTSLTEVIAMERVRSDQSIEWGKCLSLYGGSDDTRSYAMTWILTPLSPSPVARATNVDLEVK
jgi:hypothetical protein